MSQPDVDTELDDIKAESARLAEALDALLISPSEEGLAALSARQEALDARVASLSRRLKREREEGERRRKREDRERWRVWAGSGALMPELQRQAQGRVVPPDAMSAILTATQINRVKAADIEEQTRAGEAVVFDVREALWRFQLGLDRVDGEGHRRVDVPENFGAAAAAARELARKLEAIRANCFAPLDVEHFLFLAAAWRDLGWRDFIGELDQRIDDCRRLAETLRPLAEPPGPARDGPKRRRHVVEDAVNDLLVIFHGALREALRLDPMLFIRAAARRPRSSWRWGELPANRLAHAEIGWRRVWKENRRPFLRAALGLVAEPPSAAVLDERTRAVRERTTDPPPIPSQPKASKTPA